MTAFVIMTMGITGIVLQFFMRKKTEIEKPFTLVAAQYLSMIAIVVVSAYSQFVSSKETVLYQTAKLNIEALSRVSESFVPAMNNIIEIQNNYLAVSNYLSYVEAIEKNPELASVMDWKSEAGEKYTTQLEIAQAALKELNIIGAEIIRMNILYGETLPNEIVEWASITSSMSIKKTREYLDPFARMGSSPKPSVVKYSEKTGHAFGVVLGGVRKSVGVITKSEI